MPNNVPPPPQGLGSNFNYIFDSNGGSLLNPTVVINLTQQIVSNIGFSFQMNCYSPSGANSAWQQYFFTFQTANGLPGGSAGTLYGQVEPWPKSTVGTGTDTTTGDLINREFEVITISDSIMLAGYTLTIALGNDPAGNIRYVTFTVVDNLGNQTAIPTIDILTLPLDGSSTLATTADIAPIIAFQLNFVGPIAALQTDLLSGAGTITYSASNALTPLSQLPAGTDSTDITAETANSVYGELLNVASNSITQSFNTVLPPAYAPGGPFAVSQQFGLSQTDLFAIDRAGQLVVFYVVEAGHWNSTTGLGPTGLARRGAAIAASQQFGVNNQTDVFLVGQNGQLYVFWVDGAGAWNGPVGIGPGGNARSGANLAASQQFGISNQTDVFLVDKNGQLNVFWVNGSGAWNGPGKIGPQGNAPSGAPLAASQQFGLNQTDVFLVGNNGQLNVFWVDSSGAWNGPGKIGPTGLAPAGAGVAASQQFGVNNQTDVFLVDNNGQLNVFWVDGSGAWNGPGKIGAAGIAPPGAPVTASQQFGANNQTDVFVTDNNGQLNVFWVDNSGAWGGPVKIGPKGLATPGAFVAASQQFGATNQTDLFVINETGTNGPGWPMVCWVQNAGGWGGPKALVTEA